MTTSKLKLIWLALATLNLTACHSAATNQTAAAKQPPACLVPTTLISKIQGSGSVSPMLSQQVTVKALVTAVKPGMGGYYLQEENADQDNLANTSEGIFVFDNKHQPTAGDLVTLTAKVAEFKKFTQLLNVTNLTVCSQGNTLTPKMVKMPFTGVEQLESLEGMLIALEQTLTLSDTYNLSRFGQMILSNGRLWQPSNVTTPGEKANKLAALNRMNQIIVDDSTVEKNPPITFDVDHLYRTGNTVNGIEGVLHFAFGNYMLEPTKKLSLINSNPRLAKPPIKTRGKLRVASFNVLNYFNGVGNDKTFPTRRGASSKAEFVRQNAKIIAAMQVIDADILGLMEIENDGFDQYSAIAELTGNLAKATGKNYAFVRPQSDRLGDDAIAVGMIYNADTVQLQGQAQTLREAPFGGKSRLPLAQTFKDRASGESFTLVVNHFKSKRCPKSKSNPNADQGDSQGCWNPSRTLAANKLAKWLSTDPTGSKDKDMLIIGDLNANAKEDPVTTLINAGYQNIIEKYQGKHAYSFVYRGVAGYLDHALASKSMAAQIVDATDWHINADEMRLTDYNLERKSTAQQKSLFRADAFRSSDHDPMIIEISPK